MKPNKRSPSDWTGRRESRRWRPELIQRARNGESTTACQIGGPSSIPPRQRSSHHYDEKDNVRLASLSKSLCCAMALAASPPGSSQDP